MSERLATAEECRRLLRRVAAAMFDGEEAEAAVAAAVGADVGPSPESGSAMAALRNLRTGAERRLLAPSRTARREPALRAVASFADHLIGLPSEVRVERVGTCVVVADDAAHAAARWTSRLGDGADAAAVYQEVRAALATLRGAVMRLELGISRLG